MIIMLFNTINARLKLTLILPSRQPYTTVTSILEVGLLPSRQVNAGSFTAQYRCNRLRCPLARMSGLQCFNMGHNGHGINLYGVSMTLMGN